ncbi:fungal-specific transcription factor domain-containing protein [Hypoxylon crocopeplum]|nr:fungal-specific transcription factor domain-containing protein [Hypoxylon crocopeplum]
MCGLLASRTLTIWYTVLSTGHRAFEMQASKTIARRRHPPPDVLRRSAVACNRCRSRKTKCAGNPPYPCAACREIGHACVYSESEKRVSVPESYLVELQAQARASRRSHGQDGDPSAAETPVTDVEWGFTGTDNWVMGRSGQYHYMGNSSSTYIANRLNPTAETLAWHMYPHYEDTSWLRRSVNPEIPQLPPYDLAKRLYRAQHAYIGTIFSFLRDEDFYQRLKRMYARPPDPSDREDCLIYCQILLVFAFGQMYSVNQWIGNEGPPGFVYFKHALKFLPDVHEDGSILFVEVLSYVAYYNQTINRRDAAYLYIGIALRMAIALGLHQEVSDQEIDDFTREHRRRVWWSTYSMDRLLCVTSGHPISIQDDDIDVLPPSPIAGENSRTAAILARYTQLSRIQGIVGEEIYRKKQKSGTSLSASVQNIMKTLSDWFDELPPDVRLDPSDLEKAVNREAVSTYLHYYHCINMTARPLLLYAVQKQMAANAQRSNSTARWEDGLPLEIVNIIDTAIAAARSSAFILNAASKYNLVATYGFIDGEQAFSAALLLVMVNIAFPYKEMDASAMDTALHVLQSMAEKGNKYIRACHSLLTKIRAMIKPKDLSDVPDVESHGPAQILYQLQNDAFSQASTTTVGSTSNQNPAFNLDPEGDPGLWAEVLGSIGIDMDRQWIETALLREEGLDTTHNMP